MKILYGIQGTGHGHISRAREILPLLSEKADVDVLLSGNNFKMDLDDNHNVNRKYGISLKYSSNGNGSVSYLKTALNIKPIRLLRDIQSLDIQNYSLVISDFEPVTAWASLQSGVPSIGLSHQSSFLSDKSPRPQKQSPFAEQVLKHFAPCHRPVGFHFQPYDSFILPPVIRRDVRNLQVQTHDHITVYLPAFNPEFLISVFLQCPQVQWHLFSPVCDKAYEKENVSVQPVGNIPFLNSMKNSIGVITSAGFESCAEAMFLGKKLLVIPIKNQYEQLCNAAALSKMGIQVINHIDAHFTDKLNSWLSSARIIPLHKSADTDYLTEKLIRFAKKRSRQAKPGMYRSAKTFKW